MTGSLDPRVSQTQDPPWRRLTHSDRYASAGRFAHYRNIASRQPGNQSGVHPSPTDLLLVSVSPPGIVAQLDIRRRGDVLPMTTCVACNQMVSQCVWPIYLVATNQADSGPFWVRRFRSADIQTRPPGIVAEIVAVCADWQSYSEWESGIRRAWMDRRQTAALAQVPGTLPRFVAPAPGESP